MMVFMEGRSPEFAKSLRERAEKLGLDYSKSVKAATAEGFIVDKAIRDSFLAEPVRTEQSTASTGKPKIRRRTDRTSTEVHDG